jgi:hypothetical protein
MFAETQARSFIEEEKRLNFNPNVHVDMLVFLRFFYENKDALDLAVL